MIGLMYICTNHLLNPSYDDHVDPLELSLTVTVKPAWAAGYEPARVGSQAGGGAGRSLAAEVSGPYHFLPW